MSPISAGMNGNISNEALNSNSNSNTSAANSKGLLEDPNNSASSEGSNNAMGLNNLSGSSGGSNQGPMTTSTPLPYYSEGADEQPTSSTEGNFGFSAPKFGTLIPNRVFVGGISCHTTESELNLLFSRFGCVKGTKIIMDRAGVSKGYGFVTFETEEEAKRLFNAMNNREMPPIVHRDRRLNIAPAVKKQPTTTTTRQNPYSSPGISGGGGGSAFLPPPFDTPGYYLQNMNGGHVQQDFFGPPVTIPDNYFPQSTNGFPQTPVHSGSHQPYFTIPQALGQAALGPNGGLYFVPVSNFPYQQEQVQSLQSLSGPERWNGAMNPPSFNFWC